VEQGGIDELLAEAAGFGSCRVCPYLQGGTPELCFLCARQTVEPLAPVDRRCGVCDQTYQAGLTECRNPVCGMAERWFEWNYAVAIRSGVLEVSIKKFKYEGKHGWAAIFGRILVGFLDSEERLFSDTDLIVASPAYTGPGAHRSWDYAHDILVAASREQRPPSDWPFDLAGPSAVIKTAETEPMARITKYHERRPHAETAIRDALLVPDPERVRNKVVLVVDDTFTDGLTLREVARALQLQGGARLVRGVTLTRQPYGRR
jgi:predicted amidophosphoribosyltransferase